MVESILSLAGSAHHVIFKPCVKLFVRALPALSKCCTDG